MNTTPTPDESEFVSAYTGLTLRDVQKRSPAQRRQLWERDRQAIADLWFEGDVEQADEAMESLPYSAIPTWEDVDRVARAMRRSS